VATYASSAPRGISARWKYALIPLTAVWLVTFVEKVNVSLVIANKQFLTQTGLTGHEALLGVLANVFLLSYGISMFFWGAAVDRWGVRKTMVVAALLWAISEFGFASSHSVAQLFASRILLGIGEAFSFPVSLAVTERWFPPREHSMANGVWIAGADIGVVFAMPIFAVMTVNLGWPAPFWTLGILSLVVGLWFYLAFRDTPEEHPKVSEAERQLIGEVDEVFLQHKTTHVTTAQVLASGRFWLVWVLGVCTTIEVWGLTTWIPTYLVAAKHVSFVHAGYLASLPTGFALILQPLGGWLQSRFGHRSMWAILWAGLGLICLWIGTIAPTGGMAAVFLALGYATQVVNIVTFNSMLFALTPRGLIGKIGGFANGLNQILSFFAPFVMGIFIQAEGKFTGAFMLEEIVMAVMLLDAIVLTVARIDNRPAYRTSAAQSQVG
jgi:sugar phosphate permease